MESDSDIDLTPTEAVKLTTLNLLPEASKRAYQRSYNLFLEWKRDQNATSFSEKVLIAYFGYLTEKFRSSTLWTQYSMLRATLSIHHNIDIAKYYKLRAFLKRQSGGYRPKKSKIFTSNDIDTFIKEAPDEIYLATKVALIMGILGACRRHELYQMKTTDFTDLGSGTLVTIPDTKTRVIRNFTITGRYYEFYKKYVSLRPRNVNGLWFFINYQKGKCTYQRMGLNKLGTMGKDIANYLKLPNPELYTGHCFRRSSATILFGASGDIITVKCLRLGGTEIAEGRHVDESIQNKLDITNKTENTIQKISNIPSASGMGNREMQVASGFGKVPRRRIYVKSFCSQASTSSSSGTPYADPFGKDEPSCSRGIIPGIATTLELMPEQTEEPFLGVVNKLRPYKKTSDKTYCRFCLQPCAKNTSTPLSVVDFSNPGESDVYKKKMEKAEETNKMLKFCLPFYDSLTFNPVVCSICLGKLKVAYEFSQMCFKSQQLIEKYADTCSPTEKVINLNDMIEAKFKLSDDGTLSGTETFSDNPRVPTTRTISRKRKYPNDNDSAGKKQKAYFETNEDDSTNSSDTSNIKIEPDDDDNSALTESLKMEPDDEDNSCGLMERLIDDVPESCKIDEEVIKVEPDYIDCPDFIKSEQMDDIHEENKVFDEKTGIGTDIERQDLYSQRQGNASVDTKNVPQFENKGPPFSNTGAGLEDSIDN